MEYLRRTWVEVELDRIAHNFNLMRDRLSPGCRTMAVVKADAYGHGDGFVSRVLQERGADWFGVSNINEAVSLRSQGITRPILILGHTPPERVRTLTEAQVTQTVFSLEYARELSTAATKAGITLDCHLKVDTGMSRIGFYAQRGHEKTAAAEIAEVCALSGLSCPGIFTHFSCADELSADARAYTQNQFATFNETVRLLNERGISFSLRHCCNSAAALLYPEMHLDMARLGVVLYGLSPSHECEGLAQLSPAMSLYTTVTMVKSVERDVAISYGRRYSAERDGQTIASVAVGYADGYRRSFTNRGRVIVGGEYAPIVGSVCMDQMMVDVSGIPNVKSGDTVTLVGESGGKTITLDDFAHLNGTINYEEACLIGRRVPRVYIKSGREIAAVDYVIASL